MAGSELWKQFENRCFLSRLLNSDIYMLSCWCSLTMVAEGLIPQVGKVMICFYLFSFKDSLSFDIY